MCLSIELELIAIMNFGVDYGISPGRDRFIWKFSGHFVLCLRMSVCSVLGVLFHVRVPSVFLSVIPFVHVRVLLIANFVHFVSWVNI